MVFHCGENSPLCDIMFPKTNFPYSNSIIYESHAYPLLRREIAGGKWVDRAGEEDGQKGRKVVFRRMALRSVLRARHPGERGAGGEEEAPAWADDKVRQH